MWTLRAGVFLLPLAYSPFTYDSYVLPKLLLARLLVAVLLVLFVAHIVADTPTGPRGDVERSALLSDDVNNLMLLCYVHHKLVDVDGLDRFALLQASHAKSRDPHPAYGFGPVQ